MIDRKNKNDRPFNWKYIESLKDSNSFKTIALYLSHYTSTNSKEQQALLDMRNHYNKLASIRDGLLSKAKTTREEMAIDFKLGLDNGHYVKKFNTASGETLDNIYYKTYMDLINNKLNSVSKGNKYIDFKFATANKEKFGDLINDKERLNDFLEYINERSNNKNEYSINTSGGSGIVTLRKDDPNLLNYILKYKDIEKSNLSAYPYPYSGISGGRMVSSKKLPSYIGVDSNMSELFDTIDESNNIFSELTKGANDIDKVVNTTIINTGTQGYAMYNLHKLLVEGKISSEIFSKLKDQNEQYYRNGLQADLTKYHVYSDLSRGNDASVMKEMDTKQRSQLSTMIKAALHDGYISTENLQYAIVGNMIGAYITIPAKYKDKGVYVEPGEEEAMTPEGQDVTIFVKDLFKDDAEKSFRRDTNTRAILDLNESDIYGNSLDALDKGFITSAGNNKYKLVSKKDLSETDISRDEAQQIMNRAYMIQDGVSAIKNKYGSYINNDNKDKVQELINENIKQFSKQIFLQGQGNNGTYFYNVLDKYNKTDPSEYKRLLNLQEEVDKFNAIHASADIEDIQTIMQQLYNLDQ